ncbi:MAG TPA: DUF6544 family protein [Solirubrobacterales bacterium]|nr:DUF6544 family protein [Solirubrobacterales bacterium]
MTGTGDPATPRRFDPAALEGLEEPVVRYLEHALSPRAPLERGMHLEIRGEVRVGTWLRFVSVWDGDGRSFSWRARAGLGPLRWLRVHDRFADRRGSMDIRFGVPTRRLPALRLLHAENEDVSRSGAGRAALEALWVPMALLPDRDLRWRAESDELIVASFDVPPERPELRIRIAPDGGVRSYSALRWRGRKDGYVPFGADVHAETRFGGVTIPSRLTAGWGHGTAAWSPFFKAEVTAAEPAS